MNTPSLPDAFSFNVSASPRNRNPSAFFFAGKAPEAFLPISHVAFPASVLAERLRLWAIFIRPPGSVSQRSSMRPSGRAVSAAFAPLV